jgi:hypothetical protein
MMAPPHSQLIGVKGLLRGSFDFLVAIARGLPPSHRTVADWGVVDVI